MVSEAWTLYVFLIIHTLVAVLLANVSLLSLYEAIPLLLQHLALSALLSAPPLSMLKCARAHTHNTHTHTRVKALQTLEVTFTLSPPQSLGLFPGTAK